MVLTNQPISAASAASPRAALSRSARARAARRLAATLTSVSGWLIGIGMVVTVALALHSESLGSLAAPGGLATAGGRLTGLVGTYLMLVELLLIARLPWLERTVGHDRLVRWHRLLGPWPITLLVTHAALITVGYAAASVGGVVPMAQHLLLDYPNVLAATVALGLLVAAGLTSWRVARRRLRHETWWTIHLYVYLAAALALAHQVTSGAAFVASPMAKAWWLGMWFGTAGLVLVYRVLLPVWRTARHGLRVVDVRVESPDTVSVVMRGRGLDRLNVRGGQFMHWRFLRRGHFWQAHPYSLSAMPQPPFLRITVKALGDHSADLARLPIGTRVWFEGAYGAMTPEVVRGHRVLLVAGGVGLTPLRALLEDLPSGVHPVVIVRASRAEDVIHRAELEQLVAMRQGVLHVVTGSRRQVRLDRGELYRLVPDVARREVFLCGPDGLVNHLQRVLRSLGVPETSMHSESFGV